VCDYSEITCDIFQYATDVARKVFQGADVGIAREDGDSETLKR